MGKDHAIAIFNAAVAAVQPAQLIPAQFSQTDSSWVIAGREYIRRPGRQIFVIGAGKASAAMAQAVEGVLGDQVTAGIVVTKYEHSLELKRITCFEAAHPVPDEQGILATQETIRLLQQARPDDLIICLVSGGASALWIDYPPGSGLADMQKTFLALLHSGADIAEINTIRKHLSGIKGGQLVRHAPLCNWISLIISDVPGDDLAVIASGPAFPDSSSFRDAWHIVEKYQLEQKIPDAIARHLKNGLAGLVPETPGEDDEIFNRVQHCIIGNSRMALLAAKDKAVNLGYSVQAVDEQLTGDATLAAQQIIAQAEAYRGPHPACFLYGGESTVEITQPGKGGRNQHLALSALCRLSKPRITLLAAGTDGTDGPTDAAGAIADAGQLERAAALDLDPQAYLKMQDAYHFFEATGGLLKTGATQTNVMDLVVVLIE